MPETIQLSESQTLTINKSTREVLEMTSVWEPSEKKPPRHFHPKQTENFEVISGQLTVELGKDAPRVFEAGEALEIPPGTPHRMWNDGPERAEATWRVTPALKSKEQLAFISEGATGLRGLMMLWKFRKEFRLALR